MLCKFKKLGRCRFVILLHVVSPEESKIRKVFDFRVNLRNFSNTNLQMSLQKEAYWTPSLVLVESLHHSNGEVARNIFHWKMFCISSDFAWSLLNIKYLTNEDKIYVFR